MGHETSSFWLTHCVGVVLATDACGEGSCHLEKMSWIAKQKNIIKEASE